MDIMQRAKLAAFCGIALAVTVPNFSSAADIGKGREIYTNYCIGCHGPDGRGTFPDIPDFTRGDRLMRPDGMIAETIADGINAMPGFRGIINKFELLDVVAYLRTMQ